MISNKVPGKNAIVRHLAKVMLITSVCVSTVGMADERKRERRYFNEVPSALDIAAQLFPSKSRSIVINKPVAKAKQTERSVALPVLFYFGKTTLVESSMPYLDSVGEFMSAPDYVNETLVIEGHTDSVGSGAYNQQLSELRALAVKDYLVTQHGVDPMRLFPSGKGESQLYDKANSKSGKNRRVEFLLYSVKS